MKVSVFVMPKPTVLDPQGAATAEAMRHLGLNSVRQVRVGKLIEFEIDPEEEDKLETIALDLLSNPVMEDCEIVLDDCSCHECKEESANSLEQDEPPSAEKFD